MEKDRVTVVMKLGVLYLAFFLLAFQMVPRVPLEAAVKAAPIKTVSLYLEPVAEILEESRAIPLSRITAYNAVTHQTDADPHISSCGVNKTRQIAISRDLFFDSNGSKYLCGVRATIITSDGHVFTNYVIWDTMNERFSETADVLFIDESEAIEFGAKEGFLILHDDS